MQELCLSCSSALPRGSGVARDGKRPFPPVRTERRGPSPQLSSHPSLSRPQKTKSHAGSGRQGDNVELTSSFCRPRVRGAHEWSTTTRSAAIGADRKLASRRGHAAEHRRFCPENAVKGGPARHEAVAHPAWRGRMHHRPRSWRGAPTFSAVCRRGSRRDVLVDSEPDSEEGLLAMRKRGLDTSMGDDHD